MKLGWKGKSPLYYVLGMVAYVILALALSAGMLWLSTKIVKAAWE